MDQSAQYLGKECGILRAILCESATTRATAAVIGGLKVIQINGGTNPIHVLIRCQTASMKFNEPLLAIKPMTMSVRGRNWLTVLTVLAHMIPPPYWITTGERSLEGREALRAAACEHGHRARPRARPRRPRAAPGRAGEHRRRWHANSHHNRQGSHVPALRRWPDQVVRPANHSLARPRDPARPLGDRLRARAAPPHPSYARGVARAEPTRRAPALAHRPPQLRRRRRSPWLRRHRPPRRQCGRAWSQPAVHPTAERDHGDERLRELAALVRAAVGLDRQMVRGEA